MFCFSLHQQRGLRTDTERMLIMVLSVSLVTRHFSNALADQSSLSAGRDASRCVDHHLRGAGSAGMKPPSLPQHPTVQYVLTSGCFSVSGCTFNIRQRLQGWNYAEATCINQIVKKKKTTLSHIIGQIFSISVLELSADRMQDFSSFPAFNSLSTRKLFVCLSVLLMIWDTGLCS